MLKPFSYIKPASVKEAQEALKEDRAFALAGGTDLIVDMRNGVKKAQLVVDLKGIKELDTLSLEQDGKISVGATVPLNNIIENRKLRENCPVLGEAAFTIATYQLRNRATMVGNICNASPAADMAPPLFILDAQVVVFGEKGERGVPVRDFFAGVKKTTLKKGEFVIRVEIPHPPPGSKMAFLKKQRIKGHDLATINIAGLASREEGVLRICIGACSITPLLLQGTDKLFQDEKDVEKLVQKLSDIAMQSISPIDDVRSSAEYRKEMVKVYLKRLLNIICT